MSDPKGPAPLSVELPAHLLGERLSLSAAVLLTRGAGEELELYLVRRSPHLATFPGAWALPGGVLEPECDGLPEESGTAAYLACAARELFEETGVLLPSLRAAAEPMGLDGEERLEELRARLVGPRRDGRGAEEARAIFRAIVRAAGDPSRDLEPFCWTTTPAFAARRYRALYAHATCPVGAHPSVQLGELVEGRFVRPKDAWRAWHGGEMRLVPPLVFLLDHLARPGTSLAEALAAARDRGDAVDRGALHVVSPSPGVLVAPLATPTLPPATTTNCYLVGREHTYVVDPGTWDEAERERLFHFLDVVQRLDLSLAGVLVTHHHRDHVGSVAHVADRYGLPVYGHPATLRRLPVWPPRSVPLEDGAVLPLGTAPGDEGHGAPWTLTALHTPGHDIGHLVFLESHRRALIAGDLVSTLSTIVIDPPEGHLATYLQSLARVRDLGVGTILPAHGAAAPDGVALLARYLAHRAERERVLLGALFTVGAALPESLVPLVYADVPKGMHALALRSLVAGLEKLAEEGRAHMALDGRWSAAPSDGGP